MIVDMFEACIHTPKHDQHAIIINTFEQLPDSTISHNHCSRIVHANPQCLFEIQRHQIIQSNPIQ